VKLDKKHKKGFINHTKAILWLTENNYYVFNNISGLGPCDVIAMNDDGDIIKIDIKSESIRKTGTHAGHKIRRMPSEQQKKMGVKLLMVTKEGKCYFYNDD
tara:strand:+ start:4144 stop:4446 length:303 start_codon:yes stop_codon:yes gene_type:complete